MADCAVVLEAGTSVIDPGKPPCMTVVAFVLRFDGGSRLKDWPLEDTT